MSGWWAQDTTGETGPGGGIKFRFGPGGFDMRVTELDQGRLVRWDLCQHGDYTIVLFKHEGWREPVEFMYHRSTKWGTFLMSLKQLLETGKGAPDPGDVQISDWH